LIRRARIVVKVIGHYTSFIVNVVLNQKTAQSWPDGKTA